jgi:hypothetical protein
VANLTKCCQITVYEINQKNKIWANLLLQEPEIMKLPLLLLILCAPFVSVAQDVSGIWRGHFLQTNYLTVLEKHLGLEDRYKFEVQLDQRSKAFSGVTYSYLTTVFYGKANCKGTVNTNTKKVLLEELKILEVRMSGSSEACIMTLFLTYKKNGDEEFLEGTYTSMNVRDSSSCGRGTVFLKKVTTSDFYKEPFIVRKEQAQKKKTTIASAPPKTQPKTTTNPPVVKSNTPNTTTSKPPAVVKKNTTPPPTVKKPTPTPEKTIAKSNPTTTVDKPAKLDTIVKIPEKRIQVAVPKQLANRTNELVKTITVNSTEVTVDLYDNGTIDNDTVSVYLDKKLVVSKQRLTERAITVKLKLDEENDYHELVMVAENLGEIPPNTSLMVVKAGDKQYEVRITSNEQKNAVVIFKYEKPG